MILAAVALAAALQTAGAPIDRSDFRYARPLGAIPRGLVSLVLDADAVARSHDLDDVRIADGHGNQVPYVVNARTTPTVVPLIVGARAKQGSSSLYLVGLPYDTLPPCTKMVLSTTTRVFERRVTLRRPAEEQRGRSPVEIATATWSSADPDADAQALTFDCSPAGARSLEIVIDDGDNAPLSISAARLLLPSYALRFYAPGTPLTLLYGASLPPPHYDIALIAPRVLAQPAREIVLKPVTTRQRIESHLERRVFWIAIGVAVVVLLAVLARLLVSA